MTPTNNLRFVRRHVDCDNGPDKKRGRLMMILQQLWEEYNYRRVDYSINNPSGCLERVKTTEWRDVEVFDE